MRIAGIAAVFPKRIVTNRDVLEMIAAESTGHFQGNLKSALRRIDYMFNYSGIRQRRWISPDEQPIQLLSEAVTRALSEVDTDRRSVDVLIYAGIGRGFREPGNSYMVAHALKFPFAQCFDIVDACNSWSRALQLVYSLFQTDKRLRTALIVNAEFNMQPGGPVNPSLFKLREKAEIDWRFPSYTIGDATTATLLQRDPDREWEFHFSSRPDLADLCTIPEKGFEGYCALGLGIEEAKSTRIGRNGVGLFTSFGTDLFAAAVSEALAVYKSLRCPWEDIRMVFPHAASKRTYEEHASLVGSPSFYFVYPNYGNIVSASVPAGIDLARKENQIKRGDRLVGLVSSAGMSFSAYSFIY
jgi:3-oxoacyl-[acyl-carrier-protein] synthase III